ncbi:MAG: carboxy-S-adenosyl-L-methionine synthase CmoA [Desulfobulbaceae bacterium]|uniref:Carboxy-S-adenosyl-L-methionine synthase n=1 Tax=Candidatus Desulfobia pelagia TaxID=2841692 RepID=A0A8J6NA81_9BACT|nr:carboxy-S-adenosyl-L-methionine synthase CmoA [Candidatus Desulfobia pelagia]
MNRDTLFQDSKHPAEFTFNSQVAEVFDDMLERSVPCYRQTTGMMATLLEHFCSKGDTVYDLGCSTGTTLLELTRQLSHMNLSFIGLDSSQPMIEKAEIKKKMLSHKQDIRFETMDITEASLQECGAVFLNYTLQFLRPPVRSRFLKKVHKALKPGGILIVSEKIISHRTVINRAYIDLYLNFKRSQGYSETEIAKKREALENILVPFSIHENLDLLKESGFSETESFFQWFNFVSFLSVKTP